MKDLRVCPESLVLGPELGAADPLRKEERDSHLRRCRSCRRELAVAQAFKREFHEYDRIDQLGHRVAAAVGARLARSNLATVAPRRPRLSAGWYLVAAALVLVSVAAVAATHTTLRIPWHSSQLSLAGSPTASEAAPPEPAPLAPVIAEHATGVPADPSVRPLPAARAVGNPSGDPIPTARDLFASANMARHDDNGPRASVLYRELQRRYPTSAEALVSRVSLGRVLLDRLDDPAGALAQFDGYLAQTTHTALAEEALFGRATALSQLGRAEAERETWRTLLARYPSSVYADRARVRMGRNQ
jgi:hypothetical protein